MSLYVSISLTSASATLALVSSKWPSALGPQITNFALTPAGMFHVIRTASRLSEELLAVKMPINISGAPPASGSAGCGKGSERFAGGSATAEEQAAWGGAKIVPQHPLSRSARAMRNRISRGRRMRQIGLVIR
mmetsp:Transcript_91550/g.243197  ORF Transcript_91550/g.243197 Transcript_91550/m.243197 type:complete len:133 (-) Transcript_91550:36-434(-)